MLPDVPETSTSAVHPGHCLAHGMLFPCERVEGTRLSDRMHCTFLGPGWCDLSFTCTIRVRSEICFLDEVSVEVALDQSHKGYTTAASRSGRSAFSRAFSVGKLPIRFLTCVLFSNVLMTGSAGGPATWSGASAITESHKERIYGSGSHCER